MAVVSDTSPLTNLIAINRLDLLHQLYGRITIPEAVLHELTSSSKGDQEPGTAMLAEDELQALSWIEIRAITDRPLVASLLLELDEGEAEAIALAVELKAELLLIDERRGRRTAARLGVRPTGLLGALIEAKHRGFIPEIKSLLDDLIVKAGFWISRELYTRALQEAGEEEHGRAS